MSEPAANAAEAPARRPTAQPTGTVISAMVGTVV